MRKKLFTVLLIALMAALVVACSNNSNNSGSNTNDHSNTGEKENAGNNNNNSNDNGSANASKSEDGLGEPSSDLVDAAKKEGKVVVYSETSRIKNAAKEFKSKYGIDVEASNMPADDLITKVGKEAQQQNIKPDVVLASGTGRVKAELLDTKYFKSDVPDDVKSLIPKSDQDPLTVININKAFVYNSDHFTAPPVNNIWELTESEWKDRILFVDPAKLGPNYDFFTMVTQPEWADKIAAAYKRYYDKDIELTTDNAGYEWIKKVYPNIVFTQSADKNAERIGAKGADVDKVAILTYSKLRYVEEKNLAIQPIIGMDPFAGFLYKDFLLTQADTDHPNAAKLFVRFMFSKDGYKPWNTFGNYSPNPNIRAVEGDIPMDVWNKVLVGNDADYIVKNRGKIVDFIDSIQ